MNKKKTTISLNHEFFNFIEQCCEVFSNEKDYRLKFYLDKALSTKQEDIIENFISISDKTKKVNLNAIGLDLKKLEYDENCEHNLYDYELFEIFMTNPFYLHSLPIDKIINLMEYSTDIYRLILIQRANDSIKSLLCNQSTIVDDTFVSVVKIKLHSKNSFKLEPFSKSFFKQGLDSYQQKMSGIVGAHLKSFRQILINNLIDKNMSELLYLNKKING